MAQCSGMADGAARTPLGRADRNSGHSLSALLESTLSRRGFIFASALSSFVLGVPSIGKSSPSNSFDVIRHAATASGLFVNSYLYVGDYSSFLIDAQLTKSEASTVADIVRTTAKPLESIIITHPHPDHYSGLEVLGPAFPNAVIYSAPRSIDTIRSTARHWPNFNNEMEHLDSGKFVFSDVSVEVALMPDAESIAPLVVYVPSRQQLVAGDHALIDQHLWLAEGRAEAWLENLRVIRNDWKIGTVLPGHGHIGSTEVLDQTEAYIRNFLDVVGSGVSVPAARREMIRRFPKWRFEAALDTSLVAYLG